MRNRETPRVHSNYIDERPRASSRAPVEPTTSALGCLDIRPRGGVTRDGVRPSRAARHGTRAEDHRRGAPLSSSLALDPSRRFTPRRPARRSRAVIPGIQSSPVIVRG